MFRIQVHSVRLSWLLQEVYKFNGCVFHFMHYFTHLGYQVVVTQLGNDTHCESRSRANHGLVNAC